MGLPVTKETFSQAGWGTNLEALHPEDRAEVERLFAGVSQEDLMALEKQHAK
jgi:hypothetical protein